MGVTTTGSARVAAVFHPPVVPQLTDAALAAAGLPPEPYTAMHVDLIRVTPKGKWHAPGTATHRCTHVTRGFGHLPADLPVQHVSVLGEYDVCSACAHQVRIPGPAGVAHRGRSDRRRSAVGRRVRAPRPRHGIPCQVFLFKIFLVL